MTYTTTIAVPALDFTAVRNWLQRRIFDLFLCLIFVYIWQSRDISISLHFNDLAWRQESRAGESAPTAPAPVQKETVSFHAQRPPADKNDLKANHFRNLTFILNPGYVKRKHVDPAVVEAKLNTCERYVAEFAGVAVREMKRTGIPASITLSQGLLESDAGESRLSTESANHFGIKCRSKCRGCTCRNYTDDDIYDMFRVFNDPVESFREHSALLTTKRYQHLLKLKMTDYQGWAFGLKKAGYATDKKYAEKLIRIIEALKLYRFDRQV